MEILNYFSDKLEKISPRYKELNKDMSETSLWYKLLSAGTAGALIGSTISCKDGFVPVNPNSGNNPNEVPFALPTSTDTVNGLGNYEFITQSEIITKLNGPFEAFKQDEDIKKLFNDPSTLEYSASGIKVYDRNGGSTAYTFFNVESEQEEKGRTAMVFGGDSGEVIYIVLNRIIDTDGTVGLGITKDSTLNDTGHDVMIFDTELTEAQLSLMTNEEIEARNINFIPGGVRVPASRLLAFKADASIIFEEPVSAEFNMVQEQIAQSDIYTLTSLGFEMKNDDGTITLVPNIKPNATADELTFTITYEGSEFIVEFDSIKGKVLTFKDEEGRTWAWDGESLKELINYGETIKNESHIETVKIDYKGIPVNINLVSHESITTNQFIPMEYVFLNPDKTNRYGEPADKALSHAVLQGLAQAWKDGATAETLINALKADPTIGIPIFASNLDEFPKNGYQPQDMVFYPINSETGLPNEINIVFMNIPSKNFPGVEVNSTFKGVVIGLSIDTNGNLYVLGNNFVNSVGYPKGDFTKESYIESYVRFTLEALSWEGSVKLSTMKKIASRQTIIHKILSGPAGKNDVFFEVK